MRYIVSQEEVDTQLSNCQGDFLLSCYYQQIGGVAGLEPYLELLHAVDGFEEIGQHFVQKFLHLFNGVNIAGMAEGSGFGWVLHFFTRVVYKFSGGVVTDNRVVVFGSFHVFADFGYSVWIGAGWYL